jgi:hypothetical protein
LSTERNADRSGAKLEKADQTPLGKALFFGSISDFSPIPYRSHYFFNGLLGDTTPTVSSQ